MFKCFFLLVNILNIWQGGVSSGHSKPNRGCPNTERHLSEGPSILSEDARIQIGVFLIIPSIKRMSKMKLEGLSGYRAALS